MTDETNILRFEPIMKGHNDYSVFDNSKRAFVLDDAGKRRSWKTAGEVIEIAGKLANTGLAADLALV